MIIGICGKSGSGKTTLANEIINKFDNNGIHVDIDKIGHDVYKYKEVREYIIKYFGKDIVINELVDRKKLGNIVFNSKEKMDILTNITWCYMEREIDNIIVENKDKIIILDWSITAGRLYSEIRDKKILLDIPYEIRKERAMLRDSISSDKFDLREKNCLDYDIDLFDYVIKDNDKDEFKRMVKKL